MSKESHQQKDSELHLALLKIYSVYRLVLSIALLGSFFMAASPLVGTVKPVLFTYAAALYCFINIIAAAIIFGRQKPLNQQQIFFNVFIDIVAIIAIADATGGVTSGLAILLVVIIAAASIMFSRQIATLTAAIASLALLADTFRLITQNHLDVNAFLPAGLLGFILFATSFLIQSLTFRIRKAQALAERNAENVDKLLQMNQLIVQRMRTGIVVVDAQGQIKMENNSAHELLGNRTSTTLLPDALRRQLSDWRQAPDYQRPPIRTRETGPELQANFSALEDTDTGDTLIFLEDNRQIAQRAQHLKLASLGRLTASIAHEIRNPLGAISHAVQLLAESENLDPADQRLCHIIQSHSLRMNQIIENILQLSRRNPASPEKINLCNWLKNYIREYQTQHADAKITLLCDDPSIVVNMDSSQLAQVVTNLADNGLRYSQQQTGKATLTFDCRRSRSSGLPILDIIDDGPGVDLAARNNLFEPFYTTESKGTGLGLFISRELCEANQARLDYTQATQNARSCFRISFAHPDQRLTDSSHTND